MASVTGNDSNNTLAFYCDSGYYMIPEASGLENGGDITFVQDIYSGVDFSGANEVRISYFTGNGVWGTGTNHTIHAYQNNQQNTDTGVICGLLVN